jgi:hypothetical protein
MACEHSAGRPLERQQDAGIVLDINPFVEDHIGRVLRDYSSSPRNVLSAPVVFGVVTTLALKYWHFESSISSSPSYHHACTETSCFLTPDSTRRSCIYDFLIAERSFFFASILDSRCARH